MYYNAYMKKIKEPSVAGSFYTADKFDLAAQIDSFREENRNYYKNSTRLVIVPHAGLIYSGRLAYEGISQLSANVKNIFIFAPAHRVAFEGLCLSGYDEWQTPLGNIKINQKICKELIENEGLSYNDEAISPEHSLEIQVPIIQKLFNNIQIVPILIGREGPEIVEKIIEKYYPKPENAFIISSDLSHFLTEDKAKELDNKTADMIESGNIYDFKFEQACGAVGIVGAVGFANKKGYSLIRIDMANSGNITDDKSSVVGYGSWFLYEGDKNSFIERNYSDFVIDIAKLVIKSSFDKKGITLNYPQVFDELGACFVTLEKFGQLRGCIGSIVAHQSLINDLVEHSKDAAFNDYRFNPVTSSEVKDLKISVSILSDPKKIEFDGEQDLLDKITPFIDGIIIRDGKYQAVYLPSVWEQLPVKTDFLNSLKVKAGLSADYFSETFEAYRFKSTYIKEKEFPA